MTKHRVHMLLPHDLHAAIARSAQEELRTFTAEVCVRLRESLRREERAVKARFAAHNSRQEMSS
jgi:hypothetical protein